MSEALDHDDCSLLQALLSDGRPLLLFTGLMLVLSGLFALFVSARGEFLPHDVQYLGMTARELCALDQCRIVHFMFHDRVSFGGTLIAVGTLYLWLAEFPLRQRQPWAWWLLLVSGIIGFASFLTYLGYGYRDNWHAAGTLGLAPCFAIGMWRSYPRSGRASGVGALFRSGSSASWTSAFGIGRACLLFTALGLMAGGTVIMFFGMTTVFVPQDFQYLGLHADQLRAINPHLVPLIAHDRAGFGGGLCGTGITVFFCVYCAKGSRALWQALCIAGVAGFGTAIGIHPVVGYVNFVHLAPACVVAAIFLVGLCLCYRPMCHGGSTRGQNAPAAKNADTWRASPIFQKSFDPSAR